MTPEQRLKRVERILGRLATRGRKTRSDFRDKINILIDAQIRNEEVWLRHKEAWRAESHAINEQIKATDEQIKNVALAQAELTKSQKLTDRALRDFINSLRKSRNGR
jgi:hypothetical protein